MKSVSASIIVLAASILIGTTLLTAGYEADGFRVVGCLVGIAGLIAWGILIAKKETP